MYCPKSDRLCSGRFKLQAATSHSKVAGTDPPISMANWLIQVNALLCMNITTAPITTCTNSTARKTTPTLQASKISVV